MRCHRRQSWLSLISLSLLTSFVLAAFEFTPDSYGWKRPRERNADSYGDLVDSPREHFPPFRQPHRHQRMLENQDRSERRKRFRSNRWSGSPGLRNHWGSPLDRPDLENYLSEESSEDITKLGRQAFLGNDLDGQRVGGQMNWDAPFMAKSTPLVTINNEVLNAKKDDSLRQTHLPAPASTPGVNHLDPDTSKNPSPIEELLQPGGRLRSFKDIKRELPTQDSESPEFGKLLLSKDELTMNHGPLATVNVQRLGEQNRWPPATREHRSPLTQVNHESQIGSAPIGIGLGSKSPVSGDKAPPLSAKGLILDQNKNDFSPNLERFRGSLDVIREPVPESRGNLLRQEGFGKPKLNGGHRVNDDSIVRFQSDALEGKVPGEHLRPRGHPAESLVGPGDRKSVTNPTQQNGNPKPWVNFRLYLDDDGKVKLEMSPSGGIIGNPQPAEREPLIFARGNTDNGNIGELHQDAAENHGFGTNIFDHNQPNSHGNAPFPPQPPDNGKMAVLDRRPDSSVNSRKMSHLIGDSAQFGFPHHRPPRTMPFPEIPSGWGQPRLLSGKDMQSSKRVKEKTKILESAAVPLIFNVDNPLTSGCKPLFCPKTCPEDLRKLSRTTGCPTCDCCKPLKCNLKCRLGFEADDEGCPICNCI